ncbi:MAG: hypothetical protein LBS34_00100 [Rickettsiales bacterium]|jgi:hypothetical protein|nr:hypothetical protein [Rickettsiales bacterium]
MKLEASVGPIKTEFDCRDEAEMNECSQAANELNIEYNKTILHLGNVDEIVILSFILFKTGIKLHKIKYSNVDEGLFLFLKSVGGFLNSKSPEQIKKILVLINIVKKVELNKKLKNPDNEDDSVLIDRFVDDIRKKIESIENNILIY